jgi:hypothetical protein
MALDGIIPKRDMSLSVTSVFPRRNQNIIPSINNGIVPCLLRESVSVRLADAMNISLFFVCFWKFSIKFPPSIVSLGLWSDGDVPVLP